MATNIIAAFIALIGATAVALLNSFYTYKKLKSNTKGASIVELIRSVLNIAFLTLTFVISRKIGCNIAYPLIAAAIGLTVPALISAFVMAKKLTNENAADKNSVITDLDNEKTGGEDR